MPSTEYFTAKSKIQELLESSQITHENSKYSSRLQRSTNSNKTSSNDSKLSSSPRKSTYSDIYKPGSPNNKHNFGRSTNPTQNTLNDTKTGSTSQNLFYSDTPRPISPNTKYSPEGRSPSLGPISPANKHIYSRSPNPAQTSFNETKMDAIPPNTFYADITRPLSPTNTKYSCGGLHSSPTQNDLSRNPILRPVSPNHNYSEMATISSNYTKQGISGRRPSPTSRISSFSWNPFSSEIIRPVSPNTMKKNERPNEFNSKLEKLRNPLSSDVRPLSPNANLRGRRKRSVSPCNIPIRTNHRPRSPGKVYVKPPSPKISLRMDGRPPSPLNFGQINRNPLQNEGNIIRSQSKSPSRHDIGCSTSIYNSNHISTQFTQLTVDQNNKTRWTINPELKKYQSFDYSFPREKWVSTTLTPSMPTSNFYQVTDFCKQTPYLNRSLSPLPNPSNMRTENLRRILHAKDIATRINR